MRASELSKHVGQIVALDLVNAERPVGKIVTVDETNQTVTVSKPLVLMPQPDRSGSVNVMALPYGFPLYQSGETVVIDLAHIVMLLPLPEQLKSFYMQRTSGLAIAGAGALDQIDAAAKATGSKLIGL